MIRFGEKFKNVDFWPHTAPFAQYWAKQELSSKKELAHFLVFTES